MHLPVLETRGKKFLMIDNEEVMGWTRGCATVTVTVVKLLTQTLTHDVPVTKQLAEH